MKPQYILVGFLVLACLAGAVNMDNGVTTAFPESNTLSIFNADGSIGMTAIVGILVGVVCFYIFLNYDHERRLQLIAVIIILFFAANTAGLLTATSTPLWDSNWVDCTGMTTAQMQAAARATSKCMYGIDTSALICKPAQTYYAYSQQSSKFWSVHSCSASSDCTAWNPQFTTCAVNPSTGRNACYYLTSGTSGTYTSLGLKRQLVIPCLDSQNTYGKCTSDASCAPSATAFGGAWKCSSTGNCVQTSNPYKLDGQCTDNANCANSAKSFCPSGVKYSICNKGTSPTSCPAGVIKLPIGCNYQCNTAPLSCPIVPCGSGLTCVSGLCTRNAVDEGGSSGTGGGSSSGGSSGGGGSNVNLCGGVACAAGQQCISNQCVTPSYTTLCTSDAGCPVGQTCQGGTCAAPPYTPPALIDGKCSAKKDTCDAGKADAITQNTTHYTWNCLSANGGAMATCAVPIAEQPFDYNIVVIIIGLVALLIVIKIVMGRQQGSVAERVDRAMRNM